MTGTPALDYETVLRATGYWRQLALGPQVGLLSAELDDFAPAFEHQQMDAAAVLLRQ